jgi:WD40 repeat protein
VVPPSSLHASWKPHWPSGLKVANRSTCPSKWEAPLGSATGLLTLALVVILSHLVSRVAPSSDAEAIALEPSQVVCAVAFTPGGRTLASVSYDQSVRLWKVVRTKHTGRQGCTPWAVPRAPGGEEEPAGSVRMGGGPGSGCPLVTP